ncbi:MAG TPA: D-alanyl-D-alanine carboxypeptidase [Desulfotomaculum sp.]|nr:D-alanyl-D-alanine carboxypeptidase [Desulfotomaculum sp.]
MKRIKIKPVIVMLLFFVFMFPLSLGASTSQVPDINGEAAVLMDARNRQILYQKNMHRLMYPASTTKIVTAAVVLEKGKLDDTVTIPRAACLQDGSSIGLQEGEQLSLRDLLSALMLASGNDAATALAMHIANSEVEFAALMNEWSRSCGAKESNFVNPNGLPDPLHYTTAYDLALITQKIMQDPIFRQIVATRLAVIQRPLADRSKGPPQEHLWNHNRLLSLYPGAIGVKTGYTVEAGQCIVAQAKRGDRELIAVVLKSQGSNINHDAINLLDYGFNGFVTTPIVNKGAKISSLKVRQAKEEVNLVAKNSFYLNFPAGQNKNLPDQSFDRQVILNEEICAPLPKGKKGGELIFLQAGLELGRVDLITDRPVEKKYPLWLGWLTLPVSLLIFTRFYVRIKQRRTRQNYIFRSYPVKRNRR